MENLSTGNHYSPVEEKRQSGTVWWTVPNLLTVLRMLLAPLILVALLTRLEGKEFYALGLFLLASVTDWLDGYLARRRRQITHLGALLDPLADKILISSVFIAFVELNLAPAWMVTIIIIREILVTGLRGMAASRSFIMHARNLGKIKMVLQIVCISALILSLRYATVFRALGRATLWGVVLIALVSMVDYIVTYIRYFTPPSSGG